MLETKNIRKQTHYPNFRVDPEIALRRRLEEEKMKRRIGILVAAAENKEEGGKGRRISSKSEQNLGEQLESERASDISSSNAENDISQRERNKPQHFLLSTPPHNSTPKVSVHPISHHEMNDTRDSSSPLKFSNDPPMQALMPRTDGDSFMKSSNITRCSSSTHEKIKPASEPCGSVKKSSDKDFSSLLPSYQGDPSSSCSPSPKNKRSTKSKDRSNLRKGKWTAEEEEFTSRIIHYFSTGLLTLPEGTTLRSYLSEKLSCDPMRITKKFAGASCLGKRVYRLCDRTQATGNDIEMAKAELARLEQRFRARVEQGRTPFFSQETADIVASHVNSGLLPPIPIGNTNWLSQYGSTQNPSVNSFPWLFSQTGPSWFNNMGQNTLTMNLPIIPNALNMPSALPGQLQNPLASNNPLPTTPLTNLAWIQALSTMVPPIHSVAPTFNNVSSNFSPKELVPAATVTAIDHTQELWKNQQNALAAAKAAEALALETDDLKDIVCKSACIDNSSRKIDSSASDESLKNETPITIPSSAPVRSKEEEDAGSMLLGFLSTLRKGHAAAMEEARRNDEIKLQKANDVGVISSPAEDDQTKDSSLASSLQGSSNDTTHPSESSGGNSCDSETSETLSSSDNNASQGRELSKTGSSVNTDSASRGKGIDDWAGSSSDDSDKDQSVTSKSANVGIFSSKNVADHTTRMYALQNGPSPLDSLTCHNRLPERKRKRQRTEKEKLRRR